MADNKEASTSSQDSILAHAAAEAATPGANTESQYECPFCVMMRKGGCETVFKAFMECGEKADKGDQQMAECLPQFEKLHECMDKNKAVFDSLLQEMKDEEEKSKAASAAAEANSSSDTAAGNSSSAGAATHQQQQQQQEAAKGSSSSGVQDVPGQHAIPAAGSMATAS